jgi:hypothetical protein
MGLLDDAIREHLDLKRRRGADPAEVERAEREALGPVRRNAGPGEVPPDDDLIALDEDSPAGDSQPGTEMYDVPGEYDWAQEPAASAAAPADVDLEAGRGRSDAEPFAPAAPAERSIEAASAESWSTPGAIPDGLEPSPAAPAVGPETAGSGARDLGAPTGPHSGEEPDDLGELDAATAEYRLEEEPPADTAEDEDVLEETPDFLQDTPEHDRLWFEQRPPRDFDFEG